MSPRPDDWDDVAEGGAWGSEITSADLERMFANGLWRNGKRLPDPPQALAREPAVIGHAWKAPHIGGGIWRCEKCKIEAMSTIDGMQYVAYRDARRVINEWEMVPEACPLPAYQMPYVTRVYRKRRKDARACNLGGAWRLFVAIPYRTRLRYADPRRDPAGTLEDASIESARWWMQMVAAVSGLARAETTVIAKRGKPDDGEFVTKAKFLRGHWCIFVRSKAPAGVWVQIIRRAASVMRLGKELRMLDPVSRSRYPMPSEAPKGRYRRARERAASVST